VLAQLQENYPDEVRIVYRHFPLMSIHDKAALATQAAEAAGIQGKFWEMHDLLFENQSGWSQMTMTEFEAWLSGQAEVLGLAVDGFEADLKSPELVDLAQKAWDDGVANQFPGTPMLLVNGSYYGGPSDYNNLEAILKMVNLADRQFTACPPMVIDPLKQYTATLHTEKGEIVIQLFAEAAPLTVNSFVFLARNGWYDGVTFHRVLPDFVAQTGDPTGTGFGGPGYAFADEISPDLKFDKPGMVGMANAGPGSNGSQFYITLAPVPRLDGKYPIFGQVTSGMEVVESLTPRNPEGQAGLPPGDVIDSVTIEEK
jgi:cyclophilin family peptidyl-prolyl cis-trans isomerase